MVRPRSRNEAIHQIDLGGPVTCPSGQACATPTSMAPIEVISGSMLCRLKIWNEQEWAALAERDRPLEYAHVPGLGWIGALPIVGLN